MTARSNIPLGHTIPAHRAFGWCSHCPDRTVTEELAAWQTREPIDVLPVQAAEVDRLRTENERMRHELEVMYGGAFDSMTSEPADRTAVLTAAERKFLTFALDLAFDRMVSDDGFTDEDEAALEKLRRMADETPAAQPLPSKADTAAGDESPHIYMTAIRDSAIWAHDLTKDGHMPEALEHVQAMERLLAVYRRAVGA